MEGFLEKHQQFFLENITESKNGECVLWARKVQKTYRAVKYKWKCTTAHRLSFMVGTKHLYIGDRDVSHLCHNALCIRLDHLSTEPHELNCERIKCVNRGKCQGYGKYSLYLLHLKLGKGKQ